MVEVQKEEELFEMGHELEDNLEKERTEAAEAKNVHLISKIELMDSLLKTRKRLEVSEEIRKDC